jgi:hypothetical protein
MPRSKKNARRSEIRSHDVTISGFNAHFSIRAFRERGLRDPEIEGGPWLTLRGALNEPIRVCRRLRLASIHGRSSK